MSWFKKFLPIGEENNHQGPSLGFQVLKNTNPDIGLDPWFDFICGINGRLIEDGNSYLFCQEINNCAGRDVLLSTWSAKGQRMRDMVLSVPTKPSSLGLTLQWCPLSITEEIWHILDVAPNSPAELAGLLPYSDYIIGTPEGMVRGESGLGELVEDHIDRPLRLYVYNNEYDVTRELYITPTRSWGGEGMLGCVLGFGALHRIPAALHEPVQAPGEMLFEAREPEFPPTEPTNLVIPATVYQFTPTTPPQVVPPPLRSAASPISASSRKQRRAQHSTVLDMDSYLREGELKSRELSSRESDGRSKEVPPPPRGIIPPPRRGTPAEKS
ncbi:GRASP55/65 PDZ-like domain-containing protein [Geopyxis carbonaria]|nr:GRASP55/65 PDZ-like domain-containing protein [Geopyxis carbonaria]